MKKVSIFFILGLFAHFSFAQQGQDSTNANNLNEVVVSSTRANEKSGMAFSNVSKAEITKQNLGQDLPFLLNQMPSVVVSSDAGAGVGYTGIRIRGTDPTRINVTLNGIPYNDSESQGVYWVNMPDFASSVQSIQIQRGVGTSTNGAGAFGASINVNTLQLNRDAFSEVNTSAGSFNTLKTNFLASTGLLNDRFVFDARLSKITSDGFVDRASSDLKSYFLSGGYYHKNSFIRFNAFSGHEKTYQSWNGIPDALAKNDAAGIDAFVERNYYDADFKKQMLASGRTFNFYTYENEVDDYKQDNYQLISSFKLSENWRFNPTLFYTKGKGFYEQYKSDASFASYGLANIKIGETEIESTDLIRQKWLDNDFYGGVWSLDYEGGGKLKGNLGGGVNKYEGGHFGEIIWAKYASESNIRYRYYDNNSIKTDMNFYGKLYYPLSTKLDIYGDLQYRSVHFSMKGTADALQNLDYQKSYSFLNPKIGLTYQANANTSAYVSYAKGAKEPSRQDFVDNAPTQPNAEKLNDFEGGVKRSLGNWKMEGNVYYMLYKDQLVLTGKINNVGDAIRTNVAKSYRAGIELQVSGKLSEKLFLAANATFSQNKIANFVETVPSYDETPNEVNTFKNSDIAFSPNTIMGGNLTYRPLQKLEFSLLPKYVGKQYLDNTSNESRILDAYFVSDLRTSYTLKPKFMKELNFSVLVNNIFNKKYQSNGYTYSYLYGGKITENFVFPQAGTNFLAAVRLRF
ncbi:TonB-dependent receptor [Lacihabitans sp. LS3-19]|uniref:TonB-dependent receptor n=1 Tax=Lacihabitans sp. LS3-19 TaxID=2487335 RepID=UPI0020CD8A60|nr:TonB-dependent receptor [Lacihabitans sp. LS3-19]MCP9769049.1 TonB-dependent receptor [Lacihabitans sp. LS3-19]